MAIDDSTSYKDTTPSDSGKGSTSASSKSGILGASAKEGTIASDPASKGSDSAGSKGATSGASASGKGSTASDSAKGSDSAGSKGNYYSNRTTARRRKQEPQRRANTMALYIDIHRHVEGLTREAAAGVHARDLDAQEKYGVTYLRYWYGEGTGTVYYLCEAPSKEAAVAAHREAHGLVADEIIEVT